MTARPPWTDLIEVQAGAIVIRLIRPDMYLATKPRGARVQSGAIPTDEFKPSETSYGASAFVKSRLKNGPADLLAANPKWADYPQAEVPVEEILGLGIGVRLSPQDCEYEIVRDAHASLLNLDRGRRNKLIQVLEKYIGAEDTAAPQAPAVTAAEDVSAPTSSTAAPTERTGPPEGAGP